MDCDLMEWIGGQVEIKSQRVRFIIRTKEGMRINPRHKKKPRSPCKTRAATSTLKRQPRKRVFRWSSIIPYVCQILRTLILWIICD